MKEHTHPAWSRNAVAEALLTAGKLALEHFHQPAITMKHDMTLVTQADRDIEQELITRFSRPAENIHFIGEETIGEQTEEYLDDALSGRSFIVDPVDGTLPFAHGFPTWGISIGYAEDGYLQEGGLFLPTSGDLLITDGPDVYLGRLGPIPVDWDTGRMVPFHLPEEIDVSHGVISVAQDVVKRGSFSGREAVHASGSAVYAISHLALGSLSGYIANLKLWDIAGGWPILERLGFRMALEDGTPLNGRPLADAFSVEPDARDRWRIRQALYVARSDAYLSYLREHASMG